MSPMATASRTYGGVTVDQRRATRRAALIEAALDLFGEDGAQAVSKRAVCARAKLNDRYFYEHFTDSDALLEAILRDLTAGGLEAVGAATQGVGPDLRAQVHATADAALDYLVADPRRGQLLLSTHTSGVLQRARVESARVIADAMSTMIRELLRLGRGKQARYRHGRVRARQRGDRNRGLLASGRIRHQPRARRRFDRGTAAGHCGRIDRAAHPRRILRLTFSLHLILRVRIAGGLGIEVARQRGPVRSLDFPSPHP